MGKWLTITLPFNSKVIQQVTPLLIQQARYCFASICLDLLEVLIFESKLILMEPYGIPENMGEEANTEADENFHL
jgi:hypothetical protein